MSEDSAPNTKAHIKRVSELLNNISKDLNYRGIVHDRTKLEEPEKTYFDKYTPKLKTCTYMSDEYKSYLKELNVALTHHYSNNRHHPEHFKNGIKDMNLIDIIEMLMDWKASSERHDDGDIIRSIEVNKERFGYSEEIENLMKNTIKYMSDKELCNG
jgi:hypothetical protein